MTNRKCHGKIRQYGHSSTGRFRALCACGWKGKLRSTVAGAIGEVKAHDPLYPRGSRPEEMA